MVVANLPANQTVSSIPATLDRLRDAILHQLAAGRKPKDIARRLYPQNPRARRNMEHRIWKMVGGDLEFQRKVAERARAQMIVDLLPAVEATGQRAGRGRPDAAKLLMEASGFHNPRIKHEHSGEIKVKLDMPRPKFVDSTAEDVD